MLLVACCRLLSVVSQELTGTAAQQERPHVLGVPRCFDDHTTEAAGAAMGSLITEADAVSSGATTETAAMRQFTRYPGNLIGITSQEFYQQRPPLWH